MEKYSGMMRCWQDDGDGGHIYDGTSITPSNNRLPMMAHLQHWGYDFGKQDPGDDFEEDDEQSAL